MMPLPVLGAFSAPLSLRSSLSLSLSPIIHNRGSWKANNGLIEQSLGASFCWACVAFWTQRTRAHWEDYGNVVCVQGQELRQRILRKQKT